MSITNNDLTKFFSNLWWFLKWSVVIAAVGAAVPILASISPWIPIVGGLLGISIQFAWSVFLYVEEMRQKEKENRWKAYWSYELNDGYQLPGDYDVNKINEKLGIKSSAL